jgi:hypothetical protein
VPLTTRGFNFHLDDIADKDSGKFIEGYFKEI